MSKKIGVVGFPGNYGGAGVELDHQLTLWYEMGYEIHIIPTFDPSHEPLLNQTLFRAKVHNPKEYSKFTDMPVISFCNDVFLKDLEEIKKYSSKTIFVNCMTWLFEKEKENHKKGLIDLFLYQSTHTQEKVAKDLITINPNYNFKIFTSWFDTSAFPYHTVRGDDKFRFGRISREDGDKYAKDTLWVYDNMVAPVPKSGIMLGFDTRSENKIGKPADWIRTYPGGGITQQEFYAHCTAVIQKCDTTENWPRIAMESMASGSILIVDNRGGWKSMVKHRETGYLCEDGRDFVYYSSRCAYEKEEREQMKLKAFEYLHEVIINKEKSKRDWQEIFDA